MKRSRGRNRRSGGNPQNAFNNPNRHYESVGPDVKIRGSAQQVLEKYQQYARDAQTSGDRVLSEAYFQFAEHYQRIVAKQLEARQQQPQQGSNQNQNRNGGRDDRDNRPGGDRDYRGPQSGDESSADEDTGEAVVTPALTHRPQESSDADSLRVIDSDEDDAAKTTAEDQSEPGDAETASADSGPPARARRKPYKPREPRQKEDSAVAPETEGVMKTLSRGRRRPVAEDAPTETTD